MGPLIARRADGTSLGWMRGWLEDAAPKSGTPVFADVRDVARAHVLAAEQPTASGRYIVAASHTTPAAQISAWLQARRAAAGEGAACSLAVPSCTRPPPPPATNASALTTSPLLPQERWPQYEFAVGEAGEAVEAIDGSRVTRELGLVLTPVKETLLDMAATLIALGLATPRPKQ